MRKYLELFTNGFDETIEVKTKPENKPYIGYSIEESKVVYTVIPKPAAPNTYVTFTAQQDSSSIRLNQLSTYQTLEYSADTITWNTFDTTTNISLNNGDKVYVRGILSADNTTSNYTQFKMRGKIAASGNCNAIWNYEDLEAPLKAYCGYYMFRGCTKLTTAPELPSITLAYGCYQSMFAGCTKLTTAPKILPAMELTVRCYGSMFSECTSLTTAPELPATELAEECYSGMFLKCSSLTTAPELPATALATYCYYQMFNGCTSLTTVPKILPAITLADFCYQHMFYGCTSLTTAPELPATTLAKGCYSYMFERCSSLTAAPELPATELAIGCYEHMFYSCTKLNYIKCLATNISANYCTSYWVLRVARTGTFIKHPDMDNWTISFDGIPSGWDVENAEL